MKTHVLFGSSEIIEERASQLGIKPGKTLYAGHGKIINSDYLNGLDSNENKDEVINRLLSNGVDIIHKKVFKLRDWSISRQRFWGAPIPMVYDPEGNIHPVHKDDLPVILPDDVDFHPTGKSPLTYSTSFQEGVEEKYGKGWKREVDTLDTFMCSSWYYFRYLDPKNENEFASKEVLRRWMPVDFYIGGPEHVTGHLLYSRFFTKVLFDAGYINFDEPFKFHRHQGLILGEDGRRMSKRWGNVINPTQMVEEYGADAARVFEMFMGPLEATKPWDTHGVRGIKRFLSRIYDLATDTEKSLAETSTPELKVLLNSTVKKVQEDYEKLKYNTAIAKLMELINLWDKKGNSFCKSDTINFIKLIAPLAPFISEELYYFIMNKKFVTSKLEEVENFDQSIHVQSWAEYDSKLETKEDINIVVSVDGKVRGVLKNIDKNQNKDQIIDLAKSLVQKYISEKTIVDVIYVENKVVNIVT